MEAGLEQLFIDLEEALEDGNYHSEAVIVELIHETLSKGGVLILDNHNNGTYTLYENYVEKAEDKNAPAALSFVKDENNNFVVKKDIEEIKKELVSSEPIAYKDDDVDIFADVQFSKTVEPIPLPEGFETETIIKVDYHVFDKFVKDKLGIEYEFLLAAEADNDTDYRFDTTTPEDEETIKLIEKEVEAKLVDIYPESMFEYLAVKGYLPRAIYLVQVSW